MILRDLKEIQALIPNATDIDFIPVDKLARLVDDFGDSWQLLEAMLKVREEDETLYTGNSIGAVTETSDIMVAFKKLKSTSGALQFVYLLMFLKIQNPIIEKEINYLMEKVIVNG